MSALVKPKPFKNEQGTSFSCLHVALVLFHCLAIHSALSTVYARGIKKYGLVKAKCAVNFRDLEMLSNIDLLFKLLMRTQNVLLSREGEGQQGELVKMRLPFKLHHFNFA